jgi:hypothetical protein
MDYLAVRESCRPETPAICGMRRHGHDPLTRLRAVACQHPACSQPFGGRRPGPPRLMKTPAAVHPLPQGGEGWFT